MNMKTLNEIHRVKLVPLYYFDLGKIKRIDKRMWRKIPKHDNSHFKKVIFLDIHKFRGALLNRVDYEHQIAW